MTIENSLATLMNGNGNTGISVVLQKRIGKGDVLNCKKCPYTWDDVTWISTKGRIKRTGKI